MSKDDMSLDTSFLGDLPSELKAKILHECGDVAASCKGTRDALSLTGKDMHRNVALPGLLRKYERMAEEFADDMLEYVTNAKRKSGLLPSHFSYVLSKYIKSPLQFDEHRQMLLSVNFNERGAGSPIMSMSHGMSLYSSRKRGYHDAMMKKMEALRADQEVVDMCGVQCGFSSLGSNELRIDLVGGLPIGKVKFVFDITHVTKDSPVAKRLFAAIAYVFLLAFYGDKQVSDCVKDTRNYVVLYREPKDPVKSVMTTRDLSICKHMREVARAHMSPSHEENEARFEQIMQWGDEDPDILPFQNADAIMRIMMDVAYGFNPPTSMIIMRGSGGDWQKRFTGFQD